MSEQFRDADKDGRAALGTPDVRPAPAPADPPGPGHEAVPPLCEDCALPITGPWLHDIPLPGQQDPQPRYWHVAPSACAKAAQESGHHGE
ncbi:hypothetical protein ACWC5I_37220 [Kitasatospora sp. NPDC001574]